MIFFAVEKRMTRTFFLDIDGTIVPNMDWNELKKAREDPEFVQPLLDGVRHFFVSLPDSDIVIFTTARTEDYRELTERTLKHHEIQYKCMLMGLLPRILINDTPNMLYQKAIGINVLRNSGLGDTFIVAGQKLS